MKDYIVKFVKDGAIVVSLRFSTNQEPDDFVEETFTDWCKLYDYEIDEL